MKKEVITIIIVDNKLYIYKNFLEIIPLNNKIIKNGRINNYELLFENMDNSKILKRSHLKLFNDQINIIICGIYNDCEKKLLHQKLKEYGFEKVLLFELKNLLNYSLNYTYILWDVDLYRIYNNDKIIELKNLNDFDFNNPVILLNDDNFFCKKSNFYLVTDYLKYIYNLFTKRKN